MSLLRKQNADIPSELSFTQDHFEVLGPKEVKYEYPKMDFVNMCSTT